MKLAFWGVRGSYVTAAPRFSGIGGNTSCAEVYDGSNTVIFDAGSGIRRLGLKLANSPQGHISVLFSHTHWDHIRGLPYFAPLAEEGAIDLCSIDIPGIEAKSTIKLEDVLMLQQDKIYCRKSPSDWKADVTFRYLEQGKACDFGSSTVTAYALNHPGLSCGYRLENKDGIIAYICDTAPSRDMLLTLCPKGMDAKRYLHELWDNQMRLAADADAVIYDCFFTPEEYARTPHFGHSCLDDGIKVCRMAGARNIFMYHHNPSHDDASLMSLERLYRACFPDISVRLAREGEAWEIKGGRIYPWK
ncbi:MAG: MBL fold metallo-hydrolase [bacterium]|nr:MBL fold metallo-hydrolase [bacterium]